MMILSSCTLIKEQQVTPTQTQVIIGYCPTMKPYIQYLYNKGLNLNALQFNNSESALQALNSKSVHAVLPSRVAHHQEINVNVQFIRIKDGYTLITKTQSGIRYQDLPNLKIMTLTEYADAKNLLPDGTHLS